MPRSSCPGPRRLEPTWPATRCTGRRPARCWPRPGRCSVGAVPPRSPTPPRSTAPRTSTRSPRSTRRATPPPLSGEASATPIAAPAPRLRLTATGTADRGRPWTGPTAPTPPATTCTAPTTDTGTFTELTTDPVTDPTYDDTTLPAGATGFYQVTAVNAGRGVRPVRPPSAAPGSPRPHRRLRLTATGTPTGVDLDWADSTDATGYHVYRADHRHRDLHRADHRPGHRPDLRRHHPAAGTTWLLPGHRRQRRPGSPPRRPPSAAPGSPPPRHRRLRVDRHRHPDRGRPWTGPTPPTPPATTCTAPTTDTGTVHRADHQPGHRPDLRRHHPARRDHLASTRSPPSTPAGESDPSEPPSAAPGSPPPRHRRPR